MSRSLIFGWQFNQNLENVKLPKTLRDLFNQESCFFFQGNEFGVSPLGLIKVTSPESSSPKSLHWNVSSGMIVFIRLQFMSKIAGFV